MTKPKNKMQSKPKLTQDQVDAVVTADADNDSVWERAVTVRRPKSMALSIPADLMARASFVAKLHRENHVDKWVERVVRERVEIEQFAFTAAKKTLAS